MSDIFTVRTGVGAADNAMEFVDKVSGVRTFGIGGGIYTVQHKKVVVTAAQMIALNGTPVTILAAPGTGMANFVLDAILAVNFGTAQYTGGAAVTFQQNSITVFSTTAALINAAAANVLIQPAFPAVGTSASLGAFNSALTMNTASPFAAGDSPVSVHVWFATLIVP